MKNVMSILKSGVGFLLLAVIITLTVFYFNRGKDVTVKHIDGVLNAVEGVNINAIDLTSYDGEDIQGSAVISMVESLTNSTANVNVLVYTNGGSVVAEYTQTGPTTWKEDETDPDKMFSLSGNPYDLAATEYQLTGAAASATPTSANYRIKTDKTYINPISTYAVKCHYTSNNALAFVTITQK